MSQLHLMMESKLRCLLISSHSSGYNSTRALKLQQKCGWSHNNAYCREHFPYRHTHLLSMWVNECKIVNIDRSSTWHVRCIV
jgi:hypothetical protein